MTVEQTLSERGNRYGDFKDHAYITQLLKRVKEDSPNGAGLKAYQEEAIDMIFHKIGRILNGDPDYIDSWHDIVGYAKLVEDILKEKEELKSWLNVKANIE